MGIPAPQFHFLSGKAAEKLRNGSAITYMITLAATPKHAGRDSFLVQERFAARFDLCEEKYSVVQDKPGGRTVSRLTSAMAEEWSRENAAEAAGAGGTIRATTGFEGGRSERCARCLIRFF